MSYKVSDAGFIIKIEPNVESIKKHGNILCYQQRSCYCSMLQDKDVMHVNFEFSCSTHACILNCVDVGHL